MQPGGRCLHALEEGGNPYERALEVIADTLHSFDSDQLIPCYGFGDASTKDERVFSFVDGDRPCYGLDQAVDAYRALVAPIEDGGKSVVRLAGPTSFAPLIRRSMDICAKMNNRYHLLLIIADGQVTPPSRSKTGGGSSEAYSQQEKDTVEAIVAASYFPLSIVMVGLYLNHKP
jgi:E3 ubiquitin-protein ligase RGLG